MTCGIMGRSTLLLCLVSGDDFAHWPSLPRGKSLVIGAHETLRASTRSIRGASTREDIVGRTLHFLSGSRSSAGTNRRAAELMQWRRCAGGGPSWNACRGGKRLAGDHVHVDSGALVVPAFVPEGRLCVVFLGDGVLERLQNPPISSCDGFSGKNRKSSCPFHASSKNRSFPEAAREARNRAAFSR